MNNDLISRQQAFDALHCRFADGFEEDRWWNSTHVIAALKGLPSVQPERKTGRWIPCPQNASWLYVYKCSECGGYLQISDVDGIGITAKYCSYCGTKMEGGEQETNCSEFPNS